MELPCRSKNIVSLFWGNNSLFYAVPNLFSWFPKLHFINNVSKPFYTPNILFNISKKPPSIYSEIRYYILEKPVFVKSIRGNPLQIKCLLKLFLFLSYKVNPVNDLSHQMEAYAGASALQH